MTVKQENDQYVRPSELEDNTTFYLHQLNVGHPTCLKTEELEAFLRRLGSCAEILREFARNEDKENLYRNLGDFIIRDVTYNGVLFPFKKTLNLYFLFICYSLPKSHIRVTAVTCCSAVPERSSRYLEAQDVETLTSDFRIARRSSSCS